MHFKREFYVNYISKKFLMKVKKSLFQIKENSENSSPALQETSKEIL